MCRAFIVAASQLNNETAEKHVASWDDDEMEPSVEVQWSVARQIASDLRSFVKRRRKQADNDDDDAGVDAERKQQIVTLLSSFEAVRTAHANYLSLFQWYDGPLISAMRQGDMILVDEVYFQKKKIKKLKLKMFFLIIIDFISRRCCFRTFKQCSRTGKIVVVS